MKIIKMKRDSILEYLKNGSSKNCNNFNFIEYDCDAKLLSHLSTELDELLIHLTNSWALEKETLNSLSIDFINKYDDIDYYENYINFYNNNGELLISYMRLDNNNGFEENIKNKDKGYVLIDYRDIHNTNEIYTDKNIKEYMLENPL